MSNAAVTIPLEKSNIIELRVVNGCIERKDKIRYNKDGTIDKRKCNKRAGHSSEVYAFKTNEELEAMFSVFNEAILNAKTDAKKQQAYRNKLMFTIGINVGIRSSDLRTLRFSFFLKNKEGEFRESYTLQPKKQKDKGKFVTLYFNETVQKAIRNYILMYPIDDINSLMFPSQKGSDAITERTLYDIVKDAAQKANIEQNIGSHSLRKTWGFWCWHNAEDKQKAVIILQKCFGHSDSFTTLKYIGLLNDEVKDMYNSVELGIDLI